MIFQGSKAGSKREPGAALDLPELYRCVHCGLCLNQCPTYQIFRLEPESPRGRIHLVRALTEGRLEPNERFGEHLNLCLMCRACESACPSGVQYGHIAEAARELLGPSGSPLVRSLSKFAFKHLLPYPHRLRFVARLLRLYQRSGLQGAARRLLPRRLREVEAFMPPVPDQFFTPKEGILPAFGECRARIGMLSGCVMSLFFGAINEATVRVLRHNGCAVVTPKTQRCCGALNIHNGETVMAKIMARVNIDAFLAAGVDAVIVNAAGCGAAMKEYGHLLRGDPIYAERASRFSRMVKDATEFLAGLGLVGDLGRIEKVVTYQDPCHLAHGQKIRLQPRALLMSVPGIKFVEMKASDRCCGSAGIYNLTHPEVSQELLKEKMKAIAETAAEAVVAPNPGCMLQLCYGARRYGPSVTVLHLMDLLDRAYSAGGRAQYQ
ncbi:MAG: 4Fe-4S dicluster domain-containing protein [Deltaproteobacteria bacterium]|nr:4Fe-4S dicluster domain-containing protein [Deltaproteobacteria bacterium]